MVSAGRCHMSYHSRKMFCLVRVCSFSSFDFRLWGYLKARHMPQIFSKEYPGSSNAIMVTYNIDCIIHIFKILRSYWNTLYILFLYPSVENISASPTSLFQNARYLNASCFIWEDYFILNHFSKYLSCSYRKYEPKSSKISGIIWR